VLMQIHRRDSVLVISSFFLSCVCLLVRSFVRSLSVSLVRSTKVATLEPGEDISIQLQNSDATVNGHGRKLLRLCGEAAMVLCTGRTAGDTPAQPRYRARGNTEPSRLDHALVGCGLFPAVRTCKVGAHRQESDHFPLELQLLLTAPALPVSPPPPQASTPTWVWDGGQRGPYAGALTPEPCQTLIADCTAAATAHQRGATPPGTAHLELADAKFRSAVETAAHAAPLRRKQPWTGQPPHLSCYPWWNPSASASSH